MLGFEPGHLLAIFCPASLHWLLVSHSSQGGITVGRWVCGTSFAFLDSPTSNFGQRRLRHVLSPMERGKPHPPPSNPEESYLTPFLSESYLHPGSLISPLDLRKPVLNPTVFSPTGWVSRFLSTKELARCYDLPTGVIDSIPDTSLQRTKLSTIPFLNAAPSRVLMGFLIHVLSFIPLAPSHSQERVLDLDPMRPQPCLVSPGLDESCTALVPMSLATRTTNSGGNLPHDNNLGRTKAAKNDDAEIPYAYWDNEVWDPWLHSEVTLQRVETYIARYGATPLTSLRQILIVYWRRNVWRSFRQYMHTTYGWYDWLIQPGQSEYAMEWSATIEGARDGFPINMLQTPPSYRKAQPNERDGGIRDAVKTKFTKFCSKGYIQRGTACGLASYFTVPKGDGDIRLVFDGTKSGLNECIWAPSFSLPTVTSLLTSTEPGTWMADVVVGEQFYNFMLDPSVRPYCGVDLSPYFEDVTSWEVWHRCVMGLKSSPYGCIRMDLLGDEIARGYHRTPDNPFFFDSVRLNLPGSCQYDPCHPWVAKLDSRSGRIAGDVRTYVDDKRTTGSTLALCRSVTRKVAATLGYLGMQDASRKRTAPSLRAGAWAGSVCHTDSGAVTVLCTQDKWDKAKSYVSTLMTQCVSNNTFLHHELESIRGFLIYVI
jgi:hypothetical protein